MQHVEGKACRLGTVPEKGGQGISLKKYSDCSLNLSAQAVPSMQIKMLRIINHQIHHEKSVPRFGKIQHARMLLFKNQWLALSPHNE